MTPGEVSAAGRAVAVRGGPGSFVSPVKEGVALDARRIISYHHSAGEPGADLQGRLVPKRGEVLNLGAR